AYEFVSTLGWQARRFSVQIRHISNGSLHEPNCGETMLLLGVRLH
ncbi:MAG: acyloxyacyl hydrolase, partial [Rhodanobacteraceae bacterium]